MNDKMGHSIVSDSFPHKPVGLLDNTAFVFQNQ